MGRAVRFRLKEVAVAILTSAKEGEFGPTGSEAGGGVSLKRSGYGLGL